MFTTFKIVTISKDANSFGLHGHILLSRTGEAWEVARSKGKWLPAWNKGDEIKVPYENTEGAQEYNWASVNCEIPKRLPNPPQKVIDEVFSK